MEVNFWTGNQTASQVTLSLELVRNDKGHGEKIVDSTVSQFPEYKPFINCISCINHSLWNIAYTKAESVDWRE